MKLYRERLARRRARLSLGVRTTPDGREKMTMSIMTRSLDSARMIWPGATEADLGDLKLYWDPKNKDEDAAAKVAFQNAKKKGIAFYQLYSADARSGKLLTDWSEVDRDPKKRVQSAPPIRGGSIVETVHVKLASIAVHADELLENVEIVDAAASFDAAAIRSLLSDPEVVEYLEALRQDALLPVKR